MIKELGNMKIVVSVVAGLSLAAAGYWGKDVLQFSLKAQKNGQNEPAENALKAPKAVAGFDTLRWGMSQEEVRTKAGWQAADLFQSGRRVFFRDPKPFLSMGNLAPKGMVAVFGFDSIMMNEKSGKLIEVRVSFPFEADVFRDVYKYILAEQGEPVLGALDDAYFDDLRQKLATDPNQAKGRVVQWNGQLAHIKMDVVRVYGSEVDSKIEVSYRLPGAVF